MEVTSQLINQAIEKAKEGDQKSFSFLLDYFWNNVYGFQLKRTQSENDAEDITIQTFSKAFDKIGTYDSQYEFKTWLIAISKNVQIDLQRKRKSNIIDQALKAEDKALFKVADETPSGEDQLIREQNLAHLLKCIKRLKEPYQKVINLRYFQELSYKEIAKELNEPLNSVKVKLLRAKKLLLEVIQGTQE
ncbi:RNA polymerase sigma factor [Ascidiimonas sp. W6]|uniref:RNA polymerase sigma factor n=1 Tax=Ascidiimonas meishanensis TaxID=3128903 RepID=UPI0030EBB065